jgi:hypothetical protein
MPQVAVRVDREAVARYDLNGSKAPFPRLGSQVERCLSGGERQHFQTGHAPELTHIVSDDGKPMGEGGGPDQQVVCTDRSALLQECCEELGVHAGDLAREIKRRNASELLVGVHLAKNERQRLRRSAYVEAIYGDNLFRTPRRLRSIDLRSEAGRGGSSANKRGRSTTLIEEGVVAGTIRATTSPPRFTSKLCPW